MYGTLGGIKAYSVGFSFQGIAAMINFVLVRILMDKIGYEGLSYIYGGFHICSMIQLLTVYKGSQTVNLSFDARISNSF